MRQLTIFIHAIIDAIVIQRRLKKESFATVCTQLSRLTREPVVPDPVLVEQCRWASDQVAKWMPGTTCLTRSLALQRRLQAYRVLSQLCIGAEPGQGQLGAHAWIEINSVPINSDAAVGKGFRFRFVPEKVLRSINTDTGVPSR